ncbi:alpha-glucosidase [Nonomuraea thailandensis]|uniref:alpha-amylase n=1 Tax=Nonomuraea thailandensis TaxID=1188745 RepID=A0A9X2K2T9_9ACTN|nr:TIM-barrel domain-containing protein [Nonomuraea thailandensis]MCP2357639.1 alpha-glucosidase [Nonomuraea thailandensis]
MKRSLVLLTALFLPLLVAPPAQAAVQRVQFTSGSTYLIVELLDDDLVHFELASGTSPGTGSPLFTTPQVARTDYPGPSGFSQSGNTLTTAAMKVEVTTGTLCVKVSDPARLLYEACPRNLTQAWKGLTITKGSMQHAYGLGEQFFTGGSADGDWVGRTRSPGGPYGNAMVFDGDNGPVGNAQIPVLFAVGAANLNYGLLLDQVYKQEWNLTADPWTVDTWGDQLRWYTMTGPDLPDLRRDYMELTGRPPVPPKKAFGMWVSEFGYDNWAEIDNRLAGLRAAAFPVDGFVLDLPWFGGVTAGSDNTRMGSLTWDTTAFPSPAATIADYQANKGVGLMTIEESYVGRNLPEHADLASRGYLVRAGCAGCTPAYLTTNDWWGRGGMIDWTQDAAGDHWHAVKRQPLIDAGVQGHWLDLGEPEMYDAGDWTSGVLPGKHAHADYHNVYNLKWAESIARGYASGSKRPFMLARSGAAGMQRHGVAMWSADIGSKLTALAQQQNAQLHMSMSGIDYYGSDIGGFRREMLNSDLNELYTQWFANGAWFEVPVRPHTENLCNCAQTSPDQIGHTASNLANLRQRYELTPYYYSLAHRAHQFGEPVVPPPAYYHQNDLTLREAGHEKLIGRDLLVAVVAGAGERERDVYLPAGTWYDYATGEKLTSTGQWFTDRPLWVNGVFRLPAFARAGAILPKMHVDDKTMNVTGRRTDATTRNELIARVHPDTAATGFTLYEDDGASTGYRTGAVRTTQINQQLTGATATVTVAASSGTYTGAPGSRQNVIELVTDTQASAVTLNGGPLTQHATKAGFDAAASGWYNAGGNVVVAKSAGTAVTTAKTFTFTLGQAPVSATFTCHNGTTTPGQSVYAVGSAPQLGAWSVASAVKLSPTAYPTWTGTIGKLPPGATIQWKCVKRQEANFPDTADQWQPGGNSSLTTPPSGSAGTTTGTF